jgi:hypothetical protein
MVGKLTSGTSLLNPKMTHGKGLLNHKLTHGVVNLDGMMACGMHKKLMKWLHMSHHIHTW